jgi:hypothetical protein
VFIAHLCYDKGSIYILPAALLQQPAGMTHSGVSTVNDIDSTIPLKYCKCCDKHYPATTEYFPSRPPKSVLYAPCLTCKAEIHAKAQAKHKQQKREYDHAHVRQNAEKKRLYDQEYRNAPERKAKIRAEKRKWYADNRELKSQYDRQRYQEKRDIIIERSQKWRAGNAQMQSVQKQRRRTRKMGMPSTFSWDDWQYALTYFNHRCAICGRPRGLWHKLAQDHWIPIASPDCPGTIPSNIIPLCQGDGGCNNSKSRTNPADWLVTKFGKRKAAQILKRINAYFDHIQTIAKGA